MLFVVLFVVPFVLLLVTLGEVCFLKVACRPKT